MQTVKPAEKVLHIGSEGSYITHVVEPKETFYSISKKYNVTVQEIKDLNPESGDVLKTGMTLKIPFKSGSETSSKTTAPETSVPEPKTTSTTTTSYRDWERSRRSHSASQEKATGIYY